MTNLNATPARLGSAGTDPDRLGDATLCFGLSFAVTSLFDALLVVLKEINEDSLLAWMKAATGHHWVTHGVMSFALFVILGLAFQRLGIGRTLSANLLTAIVVGSMGLSALIMVGFYLVY
jgi:hypothetical protein